VSYVRCGCGLFLPRSSQERRYRLLTGKLGISFTSIFEGLDSDSEGFQAAPAEGLCFDLESESIDERAQIIDVSGSWIERRRKVAHA
jgi:hypothetical protein